MMHLPLLLTVCASALTIKTPVYADEPAASAPQCISFRKALSTLPKEIQGNPVRQKQLDAILKEAERVRRLPLVQRACSLEELEHPNGRRIGGVDKRTYVVAKTDPQKAETFAISSSDIATTALLERELPLLAAAYDITGNSSYLDRICAQLRETATWAPLQRPGWTLYTAANSLPPDGNDGVWLATGHGLAAIWQTLDILPKDALPRDVMDLVRQQFQREAEQIKRDWKAQKMWFVKQHVPTCNQWVVPASGHAIACAFLGKEADPEGYEMAVQNLLQSEEDFGTDGSASEGAGYTQSRTAPLLLTAARALAEAGDERLISKPFMTKFPTWMAMQFQPGQWLVNTNDNYGGARGHFYADASDIARLVVLSQNRTLAWTLRHVIHVMPYDFYGLFSMTFPESELRQPPLWAKFDCGQTAIWRSSWDEAASGVWIKGAQVGDFHDHLDRGHVNFIVDGKAVLIEAATPGYDNPLKDKLYCSVMGHNVLQVGDDLYPKKKPAPITVNRMDAQGGDVSVDAGAGYPQVSQWKRHVTWTKRHMEVTDEVDLKKPEKILFRWHLGSEKPLTITAAGEKAASATLPAGRITFTNPPVTNPVSDWAPPAKEIMETPEAVLQTEANEPIECTQEKNLDHAFRFRHPNHEHTTFVVRSAKAVSHFTLKTVIDVPAPEMADTHKP